MGAMSDGMLSAGAVVNGKAEKSAFSSTSEEERGFDSGGMGSVSPLPGKQHHSTSTTANMEAVRNGSAAERALSR